MKKWSHTTDKPVNSQLIAGAGSEELEDNAIISVDGVALTNMVWTARYHSIVILVPHGILIL